MKRGRKDKGKARHPFSEDFVFQTEGTVAAETQGISEGVRQVLELVAEVSLGFQVTLSEAEGVTCLFIHRDDDGLPGDPCPRWVDRRPDLEMVMDAVRVLHSHFSAMEDGHRRVILLSEIEGEDDGGEFAGKEASQ